jgi:glutaminyl-tRNA synthetase
VTRFPPEPNGYLHIGHAKSIITNFSLAQKLPGAHCNLRFDDTNPANEDTEFVTSIQEDVRWLGFDWGDHRYFASDYFQQLYDMAEKLIVAGKAYVDSQSLEAIRDGRGSFHVAGVASPFRDRSVDENLASSVACARASSTRAPTCCAPRSTWPARTSSCATRSCTAS